MIISKYIVSFSSFVVIITIINLLSIYIYVCVCVYIKQVQNLKNTKRKKIEYLKYDNLHHQQLHEHDLNVIMDFHSLDLVIHLIDMVMIHPIGHDEDRYYR